MFNRFVFRQMKVVYLKNGLVLSIVPIGNHCKFGFCAKHFLDKFIRDGLRKTLNWSLTLFRLGVLEILYDWGGVECARAVCLFISQQFLAIELSFKFV